MLSIRAASVLLIGCLGPLTACVSYTDKNTNETGASSDDPFVCARVGDLPFRDLVRLTIQPQALAAGRGGRISDGTYWLVSAAASDDGAPATFRALSMTLRILTSAQGVKLSIAEAVENSKPRKLDGSLSINESDGQLRFGLECGPPSAVFHDVFGPYVMPFTAEDKLLVLYVPYGGDGKYTKFSFLHE